MTREQIGQFEVVSDGRTVWVNGPPDGFLVARFGPNGTEVGAKVLAKRTGPDDWRPWVHAVGAALGLSVDDAHRPVTAGGVARVAEEA